MKLKCILGLLSTFACVGIFSVCAYAGTMTVEDVTGTAGNTVDVNIYISPSEEGLFETLNAFVMNLTYDSNVLTPAVVGTDLTGDELYATAADSISSGVLVSAPTETGTLAVSWADGSALSYSEKTLLYTVTFTIADSAEGTSAVGLKVIQLTADGSTLADADELAEYAAEGTITIGALVYGDVNYDDDINSYDASLVLQYYAGSADLTEEQQEIANVNGDEDINSYDASLILQHYAGSIDTFPVEE